MKVLKFLALLPFAIFGAAIFIPVATALLGAGAIGTIAVGVSALQLLATNAIDIIFPIIVLGTLYLFLRYLGFFAIEREVAKTPIERLNERLHGRLFDNNN